MFSFLVMGVCGCGKSTFGLELAKRLKLTFLDADDFHSAHSKEKMASGTPLTDEDRHGWLQAIAKHVSSLDGFVLACSALKRKYRDIVFSQTDREKMVIVHLRALLEDTLRNRLVSRKNHFLSGDALLKSQLTILEPPQSSEAAIVVEIACEDDLETQLTKALSKINKK